jgi:predicted Fe-Mo cluster-binding NifX family protein
MDKIRIAIPVFNRRISPVLDACSQLCIFDFEHEQEVHRHNLWVDDFSLAERLTILVNSGVKVIICCAVSEAMDKLLQSKNIQIIAGRIGFVEEVLEAFLANRLDDPCFLAPGYKELK